MMFERSFNMKIRRILSLALVFVVINCIITFNVTADNSRDNFGDFEDYTRSTLGDMLLLDGFQTGDSYKLSNAFTVYNFDTNTIVDNQKVYFVINDSNVVGIYSFYEIDDTFTCNYTPILLNHIDNISDLNMPIVVGYRKDILYILSENEVIYNSVDDYITFKWQTFNLTHCEFATVRPNYEFIIQSLKTRATVYNKQLDVKIVSNTTSPKSGKGVCWAACVAMKVNYTKSKNLSALTVYYDMYNKYHTEPYGNMDWYKKAYPYYGITAKYISGGIGSGDVSTAINNNKPIQIGLSRSGAAHAVIISGITIYSDHAVYTICDPNKTGCVYQYVSYGAMSDPSQFYYGNYTNWTKAVY